MKTFAVANQRGGAGKSTSAAMLSAEFALQGFRTLVVTTDPKGNAATFFIATSDVRRGLEAVIVKFQGQGGPEPAQLAPISEIIIPTAIDGLMLAPSTPAIAAFERESHLSISRLKNALKAVEGQFDFCFIDTPPYLGLTLTAALAACDYGLIPCPGTPMALEGLDSVLLTIEEARDVYPDIKIAGVFLTQFDRRYRLAADVLASLRSDLPEHVFETVINQQVKLAECAGAQQPIQLYAPKSSGARDYRALTDEILIQVGCRPPEVAAELPPQGTLTSAAAVGEGVTA